MFITGRCVATSRINMNAERTGDTGWIGTLSFGMFIVLIGVTWALNPNLHEEIISFFKDFRMVEFSGNVAIPAPASNHPVLYSVAAQFTLVFGALQIVILGLKFLYRDSLQSRIDTVSGMVFWLALSLFLNMLANGTIGWFSFVGGFLICIGLSIVTSIGLKLLKK